MFTGKLNSLVDINPMYLNEPEQDVKNFTDRRGSFGLVDNSL